jgi:hypothetical protein
MSKNLKVYLRDIEIRDNGGDAGTLFKFQCPVCREELTCSEYTWGYPTRCGCGRTWSVDVVATGEL